MWNGEFIEKDKRIYPFRACKCWACNYPYNRGVVSKLEPLKWFNSTWIGPGICENVYTGGVVEWVFNHSILEPNNSRTARVEHWRATQYSSLIRDCSLNWTPPCIWLLECWFDSLVDLIIILNADTVKLTCLIRDVKLTNDFSSMFKLIWVFGWNTEQISKIWPLRSPIKYCLFLLNSCQGDWSHGKPVFLVHFLCVIQSPFLVIFVTLTLYFRVWRKCPV